MSRKSYNGGGSVLGQNGSWSSYDPAETKDTVIEHTTKTKKNVTEIKKASRLEVMHHVLNQHIKNIDSPTLPKLVQEHILEEIKKHNSPLEWVKSQSNYEKVLLKKQKIKNQKKITEMKGASRLEVMHHVLNQHIKNIDSPTLPKLVQEHILEEIKKHNSPLEWVKSQSNYEKVLLKKQKIRQT